MNIYCSPIYCFSILFLLFPLYYFVLFPLYYFFFFLYIISFSCFLFLRIMDNEEKALEQRQPDILLKQANAPTFIGDNTHVYSININQYNQRRPQGNLIL